MLARWRRPLQLGLVVCAAAALAVAAWDLAGGGFYFIVFGARISSWDPVKPFRLGMIAIVAAMWLHDHSGPPAVATWHRFRRAAPWIAGAASVVAAGIAVRFGIRAAGGADAYGYVSQAYGWASGHLVVPNPLSSVTASIGPAVAPLGYQLADDRGWLVPIYAPGFPLMMALAATIAGRHAVFFVVPLLGGATVWLTYLLGRRTADPRTAALAALLVAFSPIFVFQSLQPMSDVPVTACWMSAWVLAMSDRRWAPLAAGLAVSAAVVTRPNLAPLAIVLAVVVSRGRRAPGRLASFAAGAVPGCVVVGCINTYLYGAPLTSGYGPLTALYAWDRFGDNLRQYATWLVDLHSPAVLLALVAPMVVRVRAALPMLAFGALLLASYLFYFVFDSWPFLRFLLPALPLLFILTAALVLRAVERAPLALRGAIVCLVATLLPGWYLVKARELHVFDISRAEHRYVAVADAVARELEPNAVVLTVLQSGSVRLYAGRATVRWDMIPPGELDAAVAALREGGWIPYVMLEEWEERPFRERFEDASRAGCLAWEPKVEYAGVSTTRIYAMPDSGPQRGGKCVTARAVRSGRPRE